MLRSLLFVLLAGLSWAGAARAQVQHCLAEDGTRIYTDRACSDLGASVWQPTPTDNGGSTDRRLGLCPRSLPRLTFLLESALDAGDLGAATLFAVRPGGFDVVAATAGPDGPMASAFFQVGDVAYVLVAGGPADAALAAAAGLARSLTGALHL